MTRHAYLAGPMTGLPDFNYPAFRDAAAHLRAIGWTITCPTETDASHGWSPGDHDPHAIADDAYREALRHGLRAAIADDVDAGVVLPDWQRSRGARAEVTALHALRLPIYRYAAVPILIRPDDLATILSVAFKEHR